MNDECADSGSFDFASFISGIVPTDAKNRVGQAMAFKRQFRFHIKKNKGLSDFWEQLMQSSKMPLQPLIQADGMFYDQIFNKAWAVPMLRHIDEAPMVRVDELMSPTADNDNRHHDEAVA